MFQNTRTRQKVRGILCWRLLWQQCRESWSLSTKLYAMYNLLYLVTYWMQFGLIVIFWFHCKWDCSWGCSQVATCCLLNRRRSTVGIYSGVNVGIQKRQSWYLFQTGLVKVEQLAQNVIVLRVDHTVPVWKGLIWLAFSETNPLWGDMC